MKNQDSLYSILISEQEIQQRVKELGEKITQDYADKNLLVVGLLRGSFIFMADLVRAIDLSFQCDFIQLASYEQNKSLGRVKLKQDLEIDLEGKDVLVVEDIVDTGTTLKFIRELIQIKKPAALKICTLLYKHEIDTQARGQLDYIGFEIADQYVVGYGLDDEGWGRGLGSIRVKDG